MINPLSKTAFAALGAPDLVYIKPLLTSEVLKDLPVGHSVEVEMGETVFGVYRADGERLAVLNDREAAFAAAFAHDLAPVSVH